MFQLKLGAAHAAVDDCGMPMGGDSSGLECTPAAIEPSLIQVRRDG
jgi:hypothetical protein